MIFDTKDYADKDREPFFREVFAREYAHTEVQPNPGAALHFRAVFTPLPDLTISSSRSTPISFQRDRRMLSDGDEDILLAIQQAGTAQISQLGCDMAVRPGEGYFWSNRYEGHGGNLSGVHKQTISVRRAALAGMVQNPDQVLGKPLSPRLPALRLLDHYLRSLHGQANLFAADMQRAVARHVLELVALLSHPTRDTVEAARKGGLRAARLKAIKDDIYANLTNSALCIDMMAVRHGVSERYIRTMFAAEHTSFTDFVRRERLALAHARLTDPAFVDRAINGIVYECGFGDLSYFNRLFRLCYGMTPSEARMEACVA